MNVDNNMSYPQKFACLHFLEKCLRKNPGNRATEGSELSTHAYKRVVTVEPEPTSSNINKSHSRLTPSGTVQVFPFGIYLAKLRLNLAPERTEQNAPCDTPPRLVQWLNAFCL